MMGTHGGVTPRSLSIAFLLIPFNSYWLIQAELVRYSGHPTCISLFFNVICMLFLIILLNALLLRLCPRTALKGEELLTIYYMLCISSFIAGHDMIQVLIPQLGHAFQFVTPENEWKLFHRYLPGWLTVRDKSALEGLYEAQVRVYPSEYVRYLRAWLPAMLIWSAFLTVLLLVMYCLNVVLRRQWMDNEKLSYPVARLPIELINDGGRLNFFRKRAVIVGLLLGALIDIINGFSFIFPSIPSIPIKRRDIGHLFTSEPWNAVGWFPISLYPFVIGMGFLIPLDLSFSCWFFYLFYKGSLVLGRAMGLARGAVDLRPNEQMLGAYIGVLGMALWRCKGYLRRVTFGAFGRDKGEGEPMSYRNALLGILFGFTFLALFSLKAGMSPQVAVLFFIIYFLISLSITRLRAELGAPVHDLWSVGSTGPDTFAVSLFGTRGLDRRTLAVLTLYYGFNRDYRGHAAPHQMESLKIAHALKLSWNGMTTATVIAAFWGGVTSFWAFLHSYYGISFGGGFGWEGFLRLQRWFFYPSSTDYRDLGFFCYGFLFTLILAGIRSRFIWFPFHPLGYALAPSWSMNLIWFPLMISWLVKLFILRYGGLRLLRGSIPFFLGLILGEFMVGGFWTLIGIFMRTPTYAFWY